MGAAVHYGVDGSSLVAGDDDGRLAEMRGAVGVGLGELGFKAQVVPGGSAKMRVCSCA